MALARFFRSGRLVRPSFFGKIILLVLVFGAGLSVHANSDLHNRCALLLSSSLANNGQAMHQLHLSIWDPTLPEAFKNPALFKLWNNLISELHERGEQLPIAQVALSNKVYPIYTVTVDPARVRAALPAELQGPEAVAAQLRKLEQQVRRVLRNIKMLGLRDLTDADRGVLRVILPWLVAYSAVQNVQLQLCFNGSEVFLRLATQGPSIFNYKFAQQLWDRYQTSVIFYAGATSFWDSKVKFNVIKGKNIVIPFSVVMNPGWRDGILRALRKARAMSSEQIFGTPYNGLAAGVHFGRQPGQEDVIFFFNKLQALQYDFVRLWHELCGRLEQGNATPLPVLIKQAVRIIRKMIVYGQSIADFYVDLWRQMLAVTPPEDFKITMETNDENFVLVQLTVNGKYAKQMQQKLLHPREDLMGLASNRNVVLRLLLPPSTPLQTTADAHLLKLIDQQLAITDQYLQERTPIWEQTDRLLENLRETLERPQFNPVALLALLTRPGPYQMLVNTIYQEFKADDFAPQAVPSPAADTHSSSMSL